MTTDLALQALLTAIWRRTPVSRVTLHSDQGSQFTGREWQSFLHQHNLEASPLDDALHRVPGNT